MGCKCSLFALLVLAYFYTLRASSKKSSFSPHFFLQILSFTKKIFKKSAGLSLF